ncbi:hypothetical protein GCM10009547_10030 [Sporichthya brevicatena]|uniref:Uncharacterized protein n=2 Tax=Sporichthya brevicatena TaxID=171442 RepID=A0ABN1GEQ0_9ACTN
MAGSVAVGAAPAWAYFSAGGTISGSTTLATATSFTATGTATGVYPGAAFDLLLTVPHTSALTIQAITPGPGSTTVTNAPGCTHPDITFNFTALPVVLAADVPSVVLANAVVMGVNAQNACQGGTFTFPVTVTAVQ